MSVQNSCCHWLTLGVDFLFFFFNLPLLFLLLLGSLAGDTGIAFDLHLSHSGRLGHGLISPVIHRF